MTALNAPFSELYPPEGADPVSDQARERAEALGLAVERLAIAGIPLARYDDVTKLIQNGLSIGFALLAEKERLEEDGVGLIAAERRRQVEQEHWSPLHDNTHVNNELAKAAAVYALPHGVRELFPWRSKPNTKLWEWIWPNGWKYKPTSTDRVRELTKAGALIAAEIDRLQRNNQKGTH